jgi:hypothetical protein
MRKRFKLPTFLPRPFGRSDADETSKGNRGRSEIRIRHARILEDFVKPSRLLRKHLRAAFQVELIEKVREIVFEVTAIPAPISHLGQGSQACASVLLISAKTSSSKYCVLTGIWLCG